MGAHGPPFVIARGAGCVSDRAQSVAAGAEGFEGDLDRLGVAGVEDLIEGPETDRLAAHPSRCATAAQLCA